MSADQYRQGDMAQDAARAITEGADGWRSGREGAQWDAIEDAARVIACYTFGHPAQPTWFLGRFEQRPWRCARCHTWWVTKSESDYGTYPDREWRWHRVQEVDDER